MSVNLYDFPTQRDAVAWLESVSSESVTRGGQRMSVAQYALMSWAFMARPGQRWTPGAERITVYSGGRGIGKNRLGSEATHENAEDPERCAGEALIIGPEPKHIEAYIIGGQSGILATAKPWLTPTHYPSKRLMKFPNPRGGGTGLEVRYASSERPRQMRGGNPGWLWIDEFAHCNFSEREGGQNFFETIQDALRALVTAPRVLVTTTPLPIPPLVKLAWGAINTPCPACQHVRYDQSRDLVKLLAGHLERIDSRFTLATTDPDTECEKCGHEYAQDVRWLKGSTLDNAANLATDYIERRVKPRANTRLGKQETDGGLLLDIPGVLIKSEWLRTTAPSIKIKPGWEHDAIEQLGLTERAVFIDPATTSGEGADESGLVCVGHQGNTGDLLALEDWTVTPDQCNGAPSNTWAPRAWEMAQRWRASIAVEDNQGGELVAEQVVKAGRMHQGRKLHEREGDGEWESLTSWQREKWASDAWDRGNFWKPKIERITQYRSKQARWEWMAPYAEGGTFKMLLPRGRDLSYWSPLRMSLSRFSPTQAKGKVKRDRGDATIGACRSILGVDEGGRGREVDPMGTVDLAGAWGL